MHTKYGITLDYDLLHEIDDINYVILKYHDDITEGYHSCGYGLATSENWPELFTVGPDIQEY